MIELMQEIVALCVKITHGSKADVFCEYEGHVDCHHVRFYENGWEPDASPEYISYLSPMDEESLTYTRDRLVKLAEKLNVEI